jgi:hypothetical protein
VIPVTTTICVMIYYIGGENDKDAEMMGFDEVVSGQATALYNPRLVKKFGQASICPGR